MRGRWPRCSVARTRLAPAALTTAATPGDAEEFIDYLRRRHAEILRGRPTLQPGEFKTAANRAGRYEFVRPEYVRGTLRAGYEHIAALNGGWARALMMMFVVSEVHPFTDGNGRLARVMMNAELSSAGLCRVMVPVRFRDEYLAAMRGLSRQGQGRQVLPGLWIRRGGGPPGSTSPTLRHPADRWRRQTPWWTPRRATNEGCHCGCCDPLPVRAVRGRRGKRVVCCGWALRYMLLSLQGLLSDCEHILSTELGGLASNCPNRSIKVTGRAVVDRWGVHLEASSAASDCER